MILTRCSHGPYLRALIAAVITALYVILGPSRSSDLSVCDFFLVGHLKSNVHTMRPTVIAELKTWICVSKCHAKSQHSLPGRHALEWLSSEGHCFSKSNKLKPVNSPFSSMRRMDQFVE